MLREALATAIANTPTSGLEVSTSLPSKVCHLSLNKPHSSSVLWRGQPYHLSPSDWDWVPGDSYRDQEARNPEHRHCHHPRHTHLQVRRCLSPAGSCWAAVGSCPWCPDVHPHLFENLLYKVYMIVFTCFLRNSNSINEVGLFSPEWYQEDFRGTVYHCQSELGLC